MKHIEFRAWHKEEQYMTDVVAISDVQVYGDNVIKGRSYNIRTKRGGDYFEWVSPSEVIVMMYTGLKDINGKKIYEGDIVEYTSPHYMNKSNKVVKYEGGGFSLFSNIAEYCEDCGFNPIDTENCKVIGNIYENPDEKLD